MSDTTPIKWHRTADGYAAETACGSYEIEKDAYRSRIWHLLVEGERYATPGTLADLKAVAETLDGERRRRIHA